MKLRYNREARLAEYQSWMDAHQEWVGEYYSSSPAFIVPVWITG